MKNLFMYLIVLFGLTSTANGQNSSEFPIEKIDSTIIVKRDLQEQVTMLTTECSWASKIGKKIDVFWLRTKNGSFFGHSYEYFMDCDNVRLIYWYTSPSETGKVVDFMIENLEDESQFVVAKKKHLKNKKKYQHLLEGESGN